MLDFLVNALAGIGGMLFARASIYERISSYRALAASRTSRTRFRQVINAQRTADDVLIIDLHPESQRDLLSNAGQPQARETPFIATTASMRSPLGPFGRRRRLGENNMRYFVCAARCGDAAPGKVLERWRIKGYLPHRTSPVGPRWRSKTIPGTRIQAMVSISQKSRHFSQSGNSP